MKMQRLLSYTRKALDDYNMIQENDIIGVGLSGGKDSFTLLYALAQLRKFYPVPFSVIGITVDLGGENFSCEPIQQFCSEQKVPYTVVNTQIQTIVFNERREKNPCSLCSKMRKGALNDAAIRLGCNKIAYGHHKDDFIETMLLSLFFEGRFHCFSPVTYLEKTKLTLIRPLMYVSEKDIIGFSNKYELPKVEKNCPADGFTKREYIKQLLKKINYDNKGVKEQLFSAIVNGNLSDWPDSKGLHKNIM